MVKTLEDWRASYQHPKDESNLARPLRLYGRTDESKRTKGKKYSNSELLVIESSKTFHKEFSNWFSSCKLSSILFNKIKKFY